MGCKVKQRRIQDTAKHLRWRFFVKIINDFSAPNYFCKAFLLKYLAGL